MELSSDSMAAKAVCVLKSEAVNGVVNFVQVCSLLSSRKKNNYIQWCPIKVRDFHQNESCPSYPHPPSSYEERREQGRQLSF